MAENIPMIALSPTMEEGVIVKWVKSEGDTVASGDVICEVETDKATMEYESLEEGVLLKIIAAEGQSVAIGDTIAIIGEQGEQVETPPQPKEQAIQPEAKVEQTVETKPKSKKTKSSPLARKLAKAHNIELESITATGPEGRITEQDVKDAIKVSPAIITHPETMEEKQIELTDKRKLIAETLSGSKFSAPHYYLKVKVIADKLVEARKKLIDTSGQKISINSFLIKLTALALKRHPIINSTWNDSSITQHSRIDIALAVSQPDGLIAPVVRQCQLKGIVQIDKELKQLIDKTRAGTLTSADYADSTFTISNLGALGIDEFTAIINPPNSAILAVGKISNQPLASDNGKLHVHQCMTLTLSCDHRLIDGAVAAAFLADLKEIIEYPIQGLY